MTKFTAYYNLCPIHDPKEFLGISPDREEGNIITTLNKNIVIIIKISTQKQIRSWTVSEKLSTKVVFDTQTQRYVGVFGNRALRCWDEVCEDVNKCKKLKFKKNIADIVVVEDNTFLVYNDGSCEILAAAIESRKEQVDEEQSLSLPTNRIFDAKISKLLNGQKVLTYFERQNPNEEIFLVRSYIESDHGLISDRFKVARRSQPDYEFKLVGYAVVESDDDALRLMSIWSDKSIYMLKLDENVGATSSPGKYVASMSSLRVDCQMAILGISRNFVAIYGANNGQEGASLLLYNTKFQVVKTKQYFKVYLDYSRLWTIDQYILLAMGQNLTVVSYSKSPDLIADLLGTQANNNFDNEYEHDLISEEEGLQENIHYEGRGESSKAIKIDGNFSISEDSMDHDFADGNKIPFKGLKDFDEALNLLNSLEISIDVVKVEDALDDVRILVMSDCNDTGFITPEVERIAQKLENCGASEWEITEKLLNVLFKANLLADIIVCLRRYTNVSDKMLVNVLKYALSNRSPRNDLPESIGHILAAVFACNFNSDGIAAFLRREIDYESVVVLMAFLYDLLENYEESKYCTRPSPKGTVSDVLQYELQIIKWFSVLLSSHFQKLVLSKDVKLVELLYKWHLLSQNYKELMGDLEETAARLYNIVQKKSFKKESSSWFTIEEVYLW